MLRHIAWFEIRYWLRSWMLWIFTGIIFLLAFFAAASDQVQVGGSLGNTYRNAPYVIENFYAMFSLLALLMVTAFINSAASRDFSCNTAQIVFSTPLRRRDFLLGRFFGATLISIIPLLGVSAGILAARYTPWIGPERWGPVVWSAHLKGILVFAIPTTFFTAAIIFTIVVLTRNEIFSFLGAILLMTGYGLSQALMEGKLERERLAALLDPFAIRTFSVATKYWTMAEKNRLTIGMSGLILWDRLIWIGAGILFLIFAYYRFSFTERWQKAGKVELERKASTATMVELPVVTRRATALETFRSAFRLQWKGIYRNTVFIVILFFGVLNCAVSVAFSAREGYGNSALPVTYKMLELIEGSLYVFILGLLTYFAGVLLWKDRDARMDEISDASPAPDWIAAASRFAALMAMVASILFLGMLCGIIVQASLNYHRFQLGLYLSQIFWRDLIVFGFTAVLAFFIHAVALNKYVGYIGFVTFVIVNQFIWRQLNVATRLVQFGNTPDVVHSDFFGVAPYITAWNWYALYWALCCGVLAIIVVMLWPRGKESGWRQRRRLAKLRFSAGWQRAGAVCLALFAATGGWIYYNTKVLNRQIAPKDGMQIQADYEKTYKQYEQMPLPRARSDRYWIDVYPERRNATIRAEEEIYNPYAQALKEIHYAVDSRYDAEIEIPGATLAKNDKRLHYRIYRFSPPLAPGESRIVKFTVKSTNHGFEDSVTNAEIVQNGTFFNNGVVPVIGYQSGAELGDPNDRRKYKLGEQELMPALERNCTEHCRDGYIAGRADWTDLDTVISTSEDQIAIAPGSLVREWRENGRRYFEYKLDHAALHFFSFMSARYEVLREDWNGIKLEVYYDRDHPWNVPRMMNSMKKSLDYYTKNFGPYYHKEARIIEFPRVGDFAQAFAGTMPYSEAIGFISNLNHPDDIDMVFYVVGHEMGHQWWAHQVLGANMQGATLLAETLAQYSSLMVMEKEYGRDMMRKFLKHEMDSYLRARGGERQEERPLLKVEENQGYIHYNKGSVVMYYMKEMIGEEAVNRALRKVIAQYGYNSPPYPTSYALVDALREQTPPELQYLIKDLFEDITLFSNRTLDAKAVKRADGKYDVTIQVEAHKYKADGKGNETEVPINDWIDIGAFAKPEKGLQYGKTLYRQRVHMTRSQASYTFTTEELPDKAGIDPFLLLIDRVPDDNTKEISLAKTSALSANGLRSQSGPNL